VLTITPDLGVRREPAAAALNRFSAIRLLRWRRPVTKLANALTDDRVPASGFERRIGEMAGEPHFARGGELLRAPQQPAARAAISRATGLSAPA
jgi:hypothetical protein